MGVSFIRTAVIYIFVLIGVRLMGKRQVGELQSFELVVMILISEIAAVPMQDTSLPLVGGLIPLATVIALEVILSAIVMKKHKTRRTITGNPMTLIKNGNIVQKAMHEVNFTLDDLFESLRLQGYSDPSQIDYAILETNGDISFFPNPNAPTDDFYIPVICDGEIIKKNLSFFNHDEKWIQNILSNRRLALSEIFLMSVNNTENLNIVFKENAK